MNLFFDNPEQVAIWVARRIPNVEKFEACTAIGVEHNGEPVAGFVYHEYSKLFDTCQISMAASSPIWAKRGIIRAALSYPFEQLKVKKLWCCVSSDNERSLKLVKGVGFQQEAILGRHFGDRHAVILRMFDRYYHRRYGNA